MDLDEILAALNALPKPEQDAMLADARKATGNARWMPNPGPQTEAFFTDADELFYGGQAGGGKDLALGTPIPTPTGWSTMGSLQVGDEVFDEDGASCRVVAKSEVFNRPAYRITFSDGTAVVAGPGHEWLTKTEEDRKYAIRLDEDWRAKRRAARPSRAKGTKSAKFTAALAARNAARAAALSATLKAPAEGSVKTTEELYHTQLSRRGALNHAVRTAAPLSLPDVALPIGPYLLGLWLGDGSSSGARLCMDDRDGVVPLAEAAVQAAGWVLTKGATKYDYGVVGGFKVALRGVGVLGNKHIPQAYLRASFAQRLALLQGLMDTDGYVDKRGQCEIQLTSRPLIDGVEELIHSLGIKCQMREGIAKLYGREISAKWRLKFLTDLPVFRLQRKLDRQKRSGFRGTHEQRYITSVTPLPAEPTQCIQVDSPSHLYLCTRAMIPTHNSDLEIGAAVTAHHRSLLLRRTNKEALGLVERMAEIIGDRDGWSGQQGIWRLEDSTVEISGCQLEDDKQKFKGSPHDLICFDEVSDFSESQYTFIIGWNRSTKPGQRCRVIAAGNPPTRPEGLWVLKRWAAWLDPNHHNPAEPGELRWYTTGEDGTEVEVDGPGPHVIGGDLVTARSRTFIPAKLSDNPDLEASGYAATLAALPEELRAAYRDGRFDAGLKDRAYQAIPTAWVRMAQERWTPTPPEGVPMCSMGVDASGGGTDPMIIAPRFDSWFAPIIRVPAKDIPIERAGAYCAGIVVSHRRDSATVVVDLGGGYGSSMYEQLYANGVEPVGYKGAAEARGRTLCGKFGFNNTRSAAIWKFREALDPGQPGGSMIALPPSATMLADLTAPTYEPDSKLIIVESKKKVCERLGRSTDEGDAVVMAFYRGVKQINLPGGFKEYNARRRKPTVVFGHAQTRR